MPLPKSFNDLVAQSDLPVLVDFWAEWCGPCHTIAPSIAQLARDYKGRLRVVKVNVDDKPQVAAQYGIRSIPTLILFSNNKIVGRQTGALSQSQLKQFVDGALTTAS